MKFNKSSGQVSRLLLVLAVVILVAVVITYLIMKMAQTPPPPPPPTDNTPALPVYETKLGDIRFVFQSSIDRGNTLRVSDAINSQYLSSAQRDLVASAGAKFIQVTVGAQNSGTENIERAAWNIENVVDSEGRNFVPLEGYTISPWLPNPDLCGALLKPAFDPTPCVKIYEVSKQSTGFKIKVQTGVDNTAQNFSSGKINFYLIDLIVK